MCLSTPPAGPNLSECVTVCEKDFDFWELANTMEASQDMKFKILAAIVLTSSLLAQMTGASTLPANLTNGLVVNYEFNGNYADSGTSGNNLTTLQNVSLTTDRFGNLDSALRYDAVDAMAISQSAIGVTGNQSRSISFWFSMNSNSGYSDFVSFGDYPSTTFPWPGQQTASLVGVTGDTGSPVFWGQVANFYAYGPSGFDLTNWHNVVFSYDGVVSASAFYMDGVLMTNTAVFTYLDALATPDTPLRIGTRDFSATDSYLALAGVTVDDVAVWSRSLSATEVTELYAAQVVPEPSTYALLLCAGLGSLWFLRRRKN